MTASPQTGNSGMSMVISPLLASAVDSQAKSTVLMISGIYWRLDDRQLVRSPLRGGVWNAIFIPILTNLLPNMSDTVVLFRELKSLMLPSSEYHRGKLFAWILNSG